MTDTKLTELTAPIDQCDFEASCPGIFATENGTLLIVGKPVELPSELAGRIQEGEAVVEIDAGILERALAGRRDGAV